MQPNIKSNPTPGQSISDILFFSFSDKMKYAIKVSLSIALAYLIPLSQGWAQASTAAITVMLIAAMGSVSESIGKGALRVLGTVIGAIIGMTLIALFPQERMLYLVSLSVCVSIVLYLLRAYKGDPSAFMLTAMTMMLVFKNGEVDNVFLYGIDKTYMTLFGIMVYSAVGIFLWPDNIEDNSTQKAMALSHAQAELFTNRDMTKKEYRKKLSDLIEHEKELQNATMDTGASVINMHQWHSLIHTYKEINATLTLLVTHDKAHLVENISSYIPNYASLEEEINTLFDQITQVWQSQAEITMPKAFEIRYDKEAVKTLTHIERASLLSTIQDMKKLHTSLCRLAKKLNAINSPLPTFFDAEEIPENQRFLWGNVEHIKAALVTFIIFWVATYFWIEMNPFGGFMVVALATGLSVLTTFTPLKPSVLIIVFTVSFVFASCMYIFILPHLHYGWELGLFIFFYSFIAFYIIPMKVSILFLIGMFTLGINNEMQYEFGLFLLILLMFYLFLVILHIFYYIPFSTKPEHLFLNLKNRFFRLSHYLLQRGQKEHSNKRLLLLGSRWKYSEVHLMDTAKQMQLWASQINEKYFDSIKKEKLLEFSKECEHFAYLVELLYDHDKKMHGNKLIQTLRESYTLPYLSDVLEEYAQGKTVSEISTHGTDKSKFIESVEKSLSDVLSKISFDAYKKEEIVALYEHISLRRNVWLALFSCQDIMQDIDFKVLQRGRF